MNIITTNWGNNMCHIIWPILYGSYHINHIIHVWTILYPYIYHIWPYNMVHIIWVAEIYHLYIEILLNGVQKCEGWCIWYFGLIGYGLEEFAFDIYGENDFASNHLDSNFEYSHDHEKTEFIFSSRIDLYSKWIFKITIK